jgi:hypothetical protein
VTRNETIRRRYLARESIVDLAAEFKVSRQRIFKILKDGGVHRPRLLQSPDPNSKKRRERRQAEQNRQRIDRRRREVERLLALGVRWSTIASVCGVEENALRQDRHRILSARAREELR